MYIHIYAGCWCSSEKKKKIFFKRDWGALAQLYNKCFPYSKLGVKYTFLSIRTFSIVRALQTTLGMLQQHKKPNQHRDIGRSVMYWIICMMLMQRQGAFIKCFVILSELGALGLLFLILNLTTTWVIYLNIAER